LPNIS
jgi:hypothetical protein